MEPQEIIIRGAQQHNLQRIDVTIPRNKFVVLTGVSGSGKSSLAFDTLYAEGQRRYVESLSAYARQFLGQMEKPKVDYIGGLSPAIAIEQKAVSKNPRSTVGTVTEVMDYLRVLYARAGVAHCPACGRPVRPQSAQQIADQLAELPAGSRFQLLAPVVRQRKGTHADVIAGARHDGYSRARIDGVPVELDSQIKLPKTKKHTIELIVDRLVVPDEPEKELLMRLADSVETTLRAGHGLVIVDLGEGEELLLSEQNACPLCNLSFPDLSPQLFSFNSPLGMCPECNGLGTQMTVDVDLIIGDPSLSLMDGALRWYGELRKKKKSWGLRQLEAIAAHYAVDLETPWQELPAEFRQALLHGSGEVKFHFKYESEWDEGSWSGESVRAIKGIIHHINRLFRQTKSDYTRRWYASFMSQQPCPSCDGARLRPEARAVTVGGRTITAVGKMAIDEASSWVNELFHSGRRAAEWREAGDGRRPAEQAGKQTLLTAEQMEIAEEVLKEIRDRLRFMLNVGLHYLTLDRPAPSLSGGEGQRIRLASQVGCGLVGVLYILDEPSIGLHARDNRALLDTLVELREMGNTVLVVEHDAETMRQADWLIDLGPGAGVLGGRVVSAGTPAEVAADRRSLTGRYLSGELTVVAPNGQTRRQPDGRWLTVVNARLHNLKAIDARFPLGLLTCVTGVSGSGKSSLVAETLHPALARALHNAQGRPGAHDRLEGLEQLDKVISITQDPIGRTPRSNPATYAKVFDQIRQCVQQYARCARRAGINPAGSVLTSKGGDARRARDMVRKRSRCTFWPTSGCGARNVRGLGSIARRWQSGTGARTSPTCWTWTCRRRSRSLRIIPRSPGCCRRCTTWGWTMSSWGRARRP